MQLGGAAAAEGRLPELLSGLCAAVCEAIATTRALAAGPFYQAQKMDATMSAEGIIDLAMADAAPDMQASLRAMEPTQRVVILQCIYYAHMFLVLRERALKRRIKLEKKKKKKLSGTFEGAEGRQEAYLAKKAAMLKQFGVDNSNTAEAQQVARIEALIETLEGILDRKGSDVRLGIIGGGRMGTQLLDLLLRCGSFSPERIRLSTRRPEGLLEYQAQGVKCEYDNAAVAGACEVLFLCCLPAHLPRVAADVAAAGLADNALVVSVVAGVTADKIQTMLGVPTVLRPIVEAPVIAAQIEACLGDAEEELRYDSHNMAAMVELAARQITSDKQNIYTILFALQRWCEALELAVGEARKVALFCIVGDPERGLEPLEQFKRRFLWTLREVPGLLDDGGEEMAAVLAAQKEHLQQELPT